MMRRRLVPMIVATIALTACGGGGDSADTAGTESSSSADPVVTEPATSPPTTLPPTTVPATVPATDPPATVPATTEPPAPVTEADFAASALLTLDDLPDGWTETPDDPTDDADDDEILAMIAECSGLDVALLGDQVLGDTKAKSGEFGSPDEISTVQQSIGFAPDEATALAAIAAIGNAALPDCYEQSLTTLFATEFPDEDTTDDQPAELVLGEVVAEFVDLTGIAAADEAVWLRVVAPLTYQAESITQHVDLIFLRVGRVLSNVELGGFGEPFPQDLVDPIMSLVNERAGSIAN
jgi:hypothetical protein